MSPFRYLCNGHKKFDGGRVLLSDNHECKFIDITFIKLFLLDRTIRRSLNNVKFVP